MVEPPEAEIVLAADAQGKAKVADHLFEKGQVLIHELLLEGLGIGGNDGPAILLFGPEDHGYEIRETLAHARACLDDQMHLCAERFLHGLGHFNLLGTMFVSARMALLIMPDSPNIFKAFIAGRLTWERRECKFYLYFLVFKGFPGFFLHKSFVVLI
jgi:hypothetical protein